MTWDHEVAFLLAGVLIGLVAGWVADAVQQRLYPPHPPGPLRTEAPPTGSASSPPDPDA